MKGFAVTAETVKREMREGAPLFFVNLRHHHDSNGAIYKARGALRLNDDEVERRLDEIPHDRPVVVYSVCPGDEPSIRAARLMELHGFDDVHPLVGGLKAYLLEGLPVEELPGSGEAKKRMLL